ncbi:hypothetical protein [Vulcaniibacterium tengchongense]|uniref:hypothetical protein n=1 Tax=Vulcaniibacterium tengchongense TaxID=1273429 RepID=UPI0013156FCE|nr:hypothetical protein [Vulcaniibacterium tengchongense]
MEVEFRPIQGSLVIGIHKPDEAFGSWATNVCRDVLIKAIESEQFSFAYADVRDGLKSNSDLSTYRADWAAFPHRKCSGRMGFVPKPLTPEQLPDAAELLPIQIKERSSSPSMRHST